MILLASLESSATLVIVTKPPLTATAKALRGNGDCKASLIVREILVPSKVAPPNNFGGIRSLGSTKTSSF